MTQSADYPDLTFIHARGDGGPRTRTQVICIHATDNTAGASGEAGYATRREDGTSAHFYVDDGTVIQALPIGHVAYGALYHGNEISVQYELCGRSNQISDATMRRAAFQVARDCKRYGIPIRKLTAGQIRAGERGICGHIDITAAFPEDGGDHSDPGANFPWAKFLSYVGGDMEQTDRLLAKTQNAGRSVGDVLGDLSNLRDWLIGETASPVGPASTAPPPTSPLAKLVAAAERPPFAVDVSALVEALRPGLAGIVAEAVADELARRLEG